MKRKLLIAATSFMIASSVCGKDFNVLTKDFQPWGNTQFDMEGMKITWTQKWQGGGWWLAQDCSEYESARIEFREVLPMDVVFIVIYSAKDERIGKSPLCYCGAIGKVGKNAPLGELAGRMP